MADLSQLVGTLLASLAHARRMTDEETAAIAEYYRDNPLLENMSVPRIRVPELVLELPVIIESFEGEEKSVLNDDDQIINSVYETLDVQLKKHGATLVIKYRNAFKKEIQERLQRLRQSGQIARREHVIKIVDDSFAQMQKDASLSEKIKPAALKQITTAIRSTASANALKKESSPPRLEATILTAKVKDEAGPKNVARLRLVMKEEGLEWDLVDRPDGTTKASLSPE